MKNWYVIHTQTGLEDKVKIILENKIVSEGLQDLIQKVIIPTEQISEIRGGKRRVTERRFFPANRFNTLPIHQASTHSFNLG